jgi:pimeloyl-ACP methyl ester carboxylesterase
VGAGVRAQVRFTSGRGLSYERRGSGSPVVLLHGWCLNGRLWTYVAEALQSDHDVVVSDQAGFGRSDHLDGPYDLDGYASDVLALLDELELADAALVGFAFGAAVAMAAAVHDDRRIGGLVSIGVPSAGHSPYDKMPRAMRRDWPEFACLSARAICKREQSDATLDWLARMFRATPLPVALATVGLLGAFDPVELAADVEVPTLYLHGDEDDIVPVSVSRACADLSPQGRLAVIEGSGHLVVLDRSQALLEHLGAFIAANQEHPTP